MKKAQMLFSAVLILSFLLPWSKGLPDLINGSVNGLMYVILSFVGFMGLMGFFVACLLVAILLLGLVIFFKSVTGRDLKNLPRNVFFLVVATFILAIATHTWNGIMQGKSFDVSLAYQLKMTAYGAYVAVASAVALLLIWNKDRTVQ